MLLRIIFTFSITLFLAPVFAGSWGGYVSYEGASEVAACHGARKHAAKLCEKNGESFYIYDNAGSCKLIKTEQHKNKTLYFVNLVFSCHNRDDKNIKGHKIITP